MELPLVTIVKDGVIARDKDGVGRVLPMEGAVDIFRQERGLDIIASSGNKEMPLGFKDDTISRKKHARIFWSKGKLMVKDLGSTNGTKVNDKPLPGSAPGKESEAVALKEGDMLTLGRCKVEIKAEPEESRVTYIIQGDLVQGDKLGGEVVVQRKAIPEKTKPISEEGR